MKADFNDLFRSLFELGRRSSVSYSDVFCVSNNARKFSALIRKLILKRTSDCFELVTDDRRCPLIIFFKRLISDCDDVTKVIILSLTMGAIESAYLSAVLTKEISH
jgi:hypothetical protein